MTKQKRLILDIINNSYTHPTAEEIYKEAKRIMPSIALGTVYRNLGIMTEEGLIRRIACDRSPDRFDRTAPRHDHFLCTKCGEVEDTDVSSLVSLIENSTGEHIEGYELMIKHVCDSCKGLQK